MWVNDMASKDIFVGKKLKAYISNIRGDYSPHSGGNFDIPNLSALVFRHIERLEVPKMLKSKFQKSSNSPFLES